MEHYRIVKEVIDNWDPKRFLHYTPEDEYDPEIRMIVELLPTVTSVENLALRIHEVFVKMFSVDEVFAISNCYPIALEIYSKIKGLESENQTSN